MEPPSHRRPSDYSIRVQAGRSKTFCVEFRARTRDKLIQYCHSMHIFVRCSVASVSAAVSRAEWNSQLNFCILVIFIHYDLCIYSASLWSQHTLFTLCHSNHIIAQSHSPLLPTCFTSSLEPASYITQDSSSKLFIPLSATFIWTWLFNLLQNTIIFFTVLLWAQNLPVQKILSSTLVCFCLSEWSNGSGPYTGLTCSSVFLCFSCIFLCISYSYVCQTKLASSLVNFWAHNNMVFDLIWFIRSFYSFKQHLNSNTNHTGQQGTKVHLQLIFSDILVTAKRKVTI